MKNIPELPGCGHMGADFLRIYTSHGHSMKTKNCQPRHLELSAQLDAIERMPSKYAAYALAVSSACDSIQLGAETTLNRGIAGPISLPCKLIDLAPDRSYAPRADRTLTSIECYS